MNFSDITLNSFGFINGATPGGTGKSFPSGNLVFLIRISMPRVVLARASSVFCDAFPGSGISTPTVFKCSVKIIGIPVRSSGNFFVPIV